MSDDFPRGGSWSKPTKSWTNPDTWAQLVTPDGCPFCPPWEPWGVYVELPASWVLLPEEAALPGHAIVVSKRHVVEPYELPKDEGALFWADCMRTAAAVARVVRPIKTNYEIHGNTIAHLHMSIYPRFRGDPFEEGCIDPKAVTPVGRTPEQLEAMRAAIAG